MNISRRQLAGVVLAGTAAAQAPPAPAPQASNELEAAKSEARLRAQIIARVPLPMATEPAFLFKA